MYNPKTVETVSGEVVSVDKIIDRSVGYWVSLTLKTGKETILVYGSRLVPRKTSLQFSRPQDQVEIIGSQITFQGKPSLIAAQVKKGDKSLKLRDPAGIPASTGADDQTAAIIGKWLLQEMVENRSLNILTRLPKKMG